MSVTNMLAISFLACFVASLFHTSPASKSALRAEARSRTARRRRRNRERLVPHPITGRPYAIDVPGDLHGNESTYTNHGCRCPICSTAGTWAAYLRRRGLGTNGRAPSVTDGAPSKRLSAN